MHLLHKIPGEVINSIDPDQTAMGSLIWSCGSVLFVYAILSEKLVYENFTAITTQQSQHNRNLKLTEK